MEFVFIIMPMIMSQESSTATTSISKARTLEEIGEFWDTHTAWMTIGIKPMKSSSKSAPSNRGG
jgi:hypothetical protein